MTNKHICGFCRNKKCPDAGDDKYDGMLGPTIGCQQYKPPLLGFVTAILVILCAILGLIAGIVYVIGPIV